MITQQYDDRFIFQSEISQRVKYLPYLSVGVTDGRVVGMNVIQGLSFFEQPLLRNARIIP